MTITINKSQRAAPSAPTLTAKPNAIVIDFDYPDYPEYAKSRIYRYPTSSDAAAHTNYTDLGMTEIFTVTDTDEDLTIGNEYWFKRSSIDIYGHESARSSAVSIIFRGVNLSDTDNTTLSAPSGTPTLTQRNRDANSDGTIDISADYSGATVSGANQYQVELQRADDNGSGSPNAATWATSDQWITPAFPAQTGVLLTSKHYRMRHRASNFNNRPGDWSAWSNTLKPVPKSSAPADPVNVEGVAGSQYKSAVRVTWDDPTDDDYAFSTVDIYKASPFVNRPLGVATTSGNVFFTTERGSGWYVKVKHYNTSGIASNSVTSAASFTIDGLPSSANADGTISTAAIADDAITAAKLAANAVGSDEIASGAVDTAELADNAITAAKILDGAVSISTETTTAGNVTVGTSYTDLAARNLTISDAYNLMFNAQFVSNVAATYDIRIIQNTTAIFEFTGVAVAANELVSFTRSISVANLPNSDISFTLQAKRSSGSGTVAQRHLDLIKFKS